VAPHSHTLPSIIAVALQSVIAHSHFCMTVVSRFLDCA